MSGQVNKGLKGYNPTHLRIRDTSLAQIVTLVVKLLANSKQVKALELFRYEEFGKTPGSRRVVATDHGSD